ncbi:lipoyl(octanoyl) transferase LipB [bacterium]|nr:lipoyl(octanoyl) transferase LipB [bacterium]
MRRKHFNELILNQTDYQIALQLQNELFDRKLAKKQEGKDDSNYLILLEHSHVFTLGKSGDISNLKVKPKEVNATYVATNRGGDITYHGPGQMVGYPILDLDLYGLGVRQYVELLEECVIDCLKQYGLKGERIKEASGVWIDAESDFPKKICAVGIKVSMGITMHGFAFNVNTNLDYFDYIVPCGLADKGVTSLEQELGRTIPMEEVQQLFISKMKARFYSN